jgi:hypothetical protein
MYADDAAVSQKIGNADEIQRRASISEAEPELSESRKRVLEDVIEVCILGNILMLMTEIVPKALFVETFAGNSRKEVEERRYIRGKFQLVISVR